MSTYRGNTLYLHRKNILETTSPETTLFPYWTISFEVFAAPPCLFICLTSGTVWDCTYMPGILDLFFLGNVFCFVLWLPLDMGISSHHEPLPESTLDGCVMDEHYHYHYLKTRQVISLLISIHTILPQRDKLPGTRLMVWYINDILNSNLFSSHVESSGPLLTMKQ